MNIMIWILTGGIAGWIGFSYVKFNADRGMMPSVIIGMVGGFFGEKVLASMPGAVISPANDFSMLSMVVALASAAACLTVGNLVSERYGV